MSCLKTSQCIPGIAFVVLCLLALGCSDDSAPRSSITLESINDGEILDCDLHNNGDDGAYGTDDDFIREDQVSIVLSNRPHDPALTIRAGGPFGAVLFHRYEVRFRGDETLMPLFGAMHLWVDSGSSAQGEIVLVPASYKTVPPLSTIFQMGEEIRLEADIKLIGEEQDSGEEITVTGTLPIDCADWVDE
jgi:hypothetical protein